VLPAARQANLNLAHFSSGWYAAHVRCNLDQDMLLRLCAEVPQNAAVGTLSSNLADIQTQTRGTSKLAAGYNSSLQGVIPIILTPAVGAFFDRFGWRMPFGKSDQPFSAYIRTVSMTAAVYIVVFALIGLTTVHPLAPILLSSFALSSNAITFIASIPILVGDDALLGTAFGVWKSFVSTKPTTGTEW
jgi:hypothetical protein